MTYLGWLQRAGRKTPSPYNFPYETFCIVCMNFLSLTNLLNLSTSSIILEYNFSSSGSCDLISSLPVTSVLITRCLALLSTMSAELSCFSSAKNTTSSSNASILILFSLLENVNMRINECTNY